MRGKLIFMTVLALLASTCIYGQGVPRAKSFSDLCDTLSARMKERTSVDLELKITRVQKNGSKLDLYFNSELSYYPWHDGDEAFFRSELGKGWDEVAKGYGIGRIYTNKYQLSEIVTPVLHSDGKPSGYSRSTADPRKNSPRFITEKGSRFYDKGLGDRYISLWQSHGLYYSEEDDDWVWQRACMHNTVEDMFTQSFVLPYLIPMLENAGAYVITPRERDTQWREIIIDNDPGFKGPRPGKMRKTGVYREKGNWTDGGVGFADVKSAYTFDDNPFTSGTQRKIYCNDKGNASATWSASFDQRGEYAVYISYHTFENSCTAAHYTVRHMGGETEFTVNQTRGGGTWIYLGTFEFDTSGEYWVRLDNRGAASSVVSADAVKIGGGMGKLERGGRVSGAASSVEGAHYWMQWAGVDKEITRAWETDYTNDFASRGAWTEMMKKDKSIPVDLSLAFHSDAGFTQKDSTIGTLAIYTLRNDGKRTLPDGRDRIINRLLCDYVQTQVVQDIRSDFNPDWSRRGIWDKSYSECRTSGVPGMILEILSHQNFADMKLGLDPKFRFTLSRAVYKGLLKTLSEYYDCPYVVQPLPVKAFKARLEDETVKLSWQAVIDDKEPTAVPESYIVYKRIDGGAFDKGTRTGSTDFDVKIEKGHIYSFKVEAENAGGRSFPSEILSAGIPDGECRSQVAVVNNFTRLSAPAFVDTPEYAGFLGDMDSGVAYIRDISYIGETYEYNREMEFIDNDYPGHGASFSNHAGEFVAGNTFDYPYIHGKILMALGHPFWSTSAEALLADDCVGSSIDLICGKQGGNYEVFPAALRQTLESFTAQGGNILVSGSRIASGCKDDSPAQEFISRTLGIVLSSPYGTPGNRIAGMEFHSGRNPFSYGVEKPDALKAASKKAKVWMKYPDTGKGAAVWFKGENHKSVSIAVPIETLKDESEMTDLVRIALEYFDRGTEPVYHGKDEGR